MTLLFFYYATACKSILRIGILNYMEKSLILTGFMGMGKSTVGQRAAELLGTTFIDTDAQMEQWGIHIPTLVKKNMELFRITEAYTLGNILDTREGVISTGGGIVTTELGRKALLSSGVERVWLQGSFELAAERVLHDTGRSRPLFDDLEEARALFDKRQWCYEGTATHRVDASQPAEKVAMDIVSIFRKNRMSL